MHILVLLCIVQLKPVNYALKYNNHTIQNKKYFILGNSHAQCALNDTLLGNEYLNVAKSAEPLFYTAIKAQNIIDQLKPDTLIIQVDNSALASIQWVLANNRLVENYRNYFSLMPLQDHEFLFRHNFFKSLKAVSFLTLSDIKNYKNLDGGYWYISASLKDSIKIIKDDKKLIDPNKYSSQLQHRNLDALEELIRRNRNTIFFITRMPMHKTVHLYREVEFEDYVNQLKQLPNCIYYDFHNKVDLPDSCYADLQHLNYKGARIFSTEFKNVWSKVKSER